MAKIAQGHHQLSDVPVKRPTFFISSTIYDFRDLRSAIKFTLEARGCRVLASEFNDFGGNLDLHSYEACLSNIEQADYFVLLVGARVGGWYDQPNKISITQKEYRVAYERHEKGLIKIVSLVRSEVWQLREDRKALERHLSEMNLSDEEKKSIQNFKSKFANDSEFISNFLTEIGKNKETSIAVGGSSPKPTGNWIYVFQNFRDIHDVLHPLAFSGQTADEAAFAKALQHELIVVLGLLLIKHDGDPWDLRVWLRRHLNEFAIDRSAKLEGTFSVDYEKWQFFSSNLMHLLGISIDMIVIKDALVSSVFLEYSSSVGAYVQTPAYEALFQLVKEIRMFNAANTSDNMALIVEFSPKNIGRGHKFIDIPTQRLAMLHGLSHRWINIISLTMALIAYLEGRPFVAPELMPFSPIKGMDEEIQKERVSPADVRVALGL